MNGINPWQTTPRKSAVIFSFCCFLHLHNVRVCERHHGNGARACAPLRGFSPAFGTIRCCLCRHRHHSERSVLKGCLPLFASQFVVMGMLGHWFPDAPQSVQAAPKWSACTRDSRSMP